MRASNLQFISFLISLVTHGRFLDLTLAVLSLRWSLTIPWNSDSKAKTESSMLSKMLLIHHGAWFISLVNNSSFKFLKLYVLLKIDFKLDF